MPQQQYNIIIEPGYHVCNAHDAPRPHRTHTVEQNYQVRKAEAIKRTKWNAQTGTHKTVCRENNRQCQKRENPRPFPSPPPPFDDEDARNSIMNVPESPSANPIIASPRARQPPTAQPPVLAPPLLRSARTVPKRTQTHTRAILTSTAFTEERPWHPNTSASDRSNRRMRALAPVPRLVVVVVVVVVVAPAAYADPAATCTGTGMGMGTGRRTRRPRGRICRLKSRL